MIRTASKSKNSHDAWDLSIFIGFGRPPDRRLNRVIGGVSGSATKNGREGRRTSVYLRIRSDIRKSRTGAHSGEIKPPFDF
jgi:hypothetical protein